MPRLLIIGPKLSGDFIEVVALELAGDVLFVIYAMRLCPSYHRYLTRRHGS